MERIKVIISGDYEIFGNGTGDVRRCMIEPTNDILDICNKYGAKFTIFAEMCEYWAFKHYAEELKNDLGYFPHKVIEEQLLRAVREGHDVQLHLHAQWINAAYAAGKWKLNYEWWRLPDLPHGLGENDDILSLRGIIRKGKETLESLLRTEDASYECIAFRSGGWCIQPENEVLQALEDNNIQVDSTVAKGRYFVEEPYFVDFRGAYSNCMSWYVSTDDINRADSKKEGSILEVPIFSMEYRRYLRILDIIIGNILGKRKETNEYKNRDGGPYLRSKKDKIDMIKDIFGKKYYFWNISNSFYMNKKMYEDFRKNTDLNGSYSLVMEGHPKSFYRKTGLDKTLAYLAADRENEFVQDKDIVRDRT